MCWTSAILTPGKRAGPHDLVVDVIALLGRMTDSLMSIRLHTQREKVTGGATETLDIDIQDELGARI